MCKKSEKVYKLLTLACASIFFLHFVYSCEIVFFDFFQNITYHIKKKTFSLILGSTCLNTGLNCICAVSN